MVFEEPLSAQCEICGERRSESQIGVLRKKAKTASGKQTYIDVTYCMGLDKCTREAVQLAARKVKQIGHG